MRLSQEGQGTSAAYPAKSTESLWTPCPRVWLYQISCGLKPHGAAEAPKPGRCIKATSHIDLEHNIQPKTQQPQQLPVKITGEAVIILHSIQSIREVPQKLGAPLQFDPHPQSHVSQLSKSHPWWHAVKKAAEACHWEGSCSRQSVSKGSCE